MAPLLIHSARGDAALVRRFAVQCLFRCGWPPADTADASHRYEERITLWRAGTIDEAIAKAEA